MRAGRLGAVVAVTTALPHAALSSGHDCAPGPLFALMNVLTLACLVCAWHLWTRPTARAWSAGTAMNFAMLAGHAALIGSGRHPTASPALLAWAALGSGVELVVAIAAMRSARAGR
ncbi:hypothetical protein [Nocardia heshunensis]